MLIRNNFAAPVLISDIFITPFGSGFLLAPNATVAIFNNVANGSANLALLIAEGVITNLGAQEPIGGTGIQVQGAQGIQGVQGVPGPVNLGTQTQALDMGSHKIVSVANPTASQDAATKAYVDQVSAGLIWLGPVIDTCLADDSLSTPPGSPPYSVVYIVGAGGTGAWSGLDGHAVEWIHPNGGGPLQWVDLLGRSVQVGDRFLVTAVHGSGDEGGSFVGKHNYICVVSGGSAGAWTYTLTNPSSTDTLLDNNVNSDRFGDSYTYSAISSSWVQVSGPLVLGAGSALAYSGANDSVLGVLVDGSTVTVNGSNQLQAPPLPVRTRQVLTASGTYTTPAGARQIIVRQVGGGGGSGGSSGAGGSGGTTSFGAVSVAGGGGSAAQSFVAATGGAGGTGGTGGSLPSTVRGMGAFGSPCWGGVSTFSAPGNPGSSRVPGGGSGAPGGATGNNFSGGGGAGEDAETIFNSPAATYAVVVGAGGAAGAGSGGFLGQGGVAIVDELY